jgi:arylsulfatase A-like enzyme
MGLLPHTSPAHVYASDYYKQDFLRYSERLSVPGVDFARLLPALYLPQFLRNVLGYYTCAMVSMPVLNPATPLNYGFDRYELMPTHNDMAAMVSRLDFPADRPAFYLLNVGETHYPYALPGDDAMEWPQISGVHGVLKRLDGKGATDSFSERQLAELRARQIRAASYLDNAIECLFDTIPRNTWVIVTADHGELFGESGYFGHGPIAHEKVFEVPFIEGRLR